VRRLSRFQRGVSLAQARTLGSSIEAERSTVTFDGASPGRPRRHRPLGFGITLAALVVGALIVRLWGVRHGLPFVYNVDEGAHFVPRAIGMFGHSANPGYFINPPAFTYLLHAIFAIRWGGDRDAVTAAFALDPSTAFTLARVASATLGAAAVALLAIAGARFAGPRAGLVAGAVMALAFLPVHYSHLALNDVPALMPICLALVGVAGIYRNGRMREYTLAGVALGLGCATKYTAGIIVVSLLAAAVVSRAGGRREARIRGVAVAAACAVGAFLLANPYSVLDARAFLGGLHKQSSTAGEVGGKLGLEQRSPLLYYIGTLTWGLGWLPSLAAAGGAARLLLRDRRLAAVLVPPPLLFLVYMGIQGRFFARWMLPIYPLLCLLAAVGAVWAADWVAARVRRGWSGTWVPAAAAAVLLCAQGAVLVVHNDAVLTRRDTRQIARDWMKAHVPVGSRVVVEPVVPQQWVSDPGHASRTVTGDRWLKWLTGRFRGHSVKLEDFERTTRPALLARYRRAGYCWVLTGSTQYGRANVDPGRVPAAIRYYEQLRRGSKVVFRTRPYGPSDQVRFSFDGPFDYHPLRYRRPGPEIVIYRLNDCTPRIG
jgi:hypothetical protein